MGIRMSVYMSDDLKKRMEAVKEPVNWSALACAAFEHKLGEIAQRKQVKNMKDAIQRLRASMLEEGSENRKRGRDDGADWAEHRAAAKELKRLDAAVQNVLSVFDDLFHVDDDNSAYSSGECFVMCLLPDGRFDRDDSSDFWATNVGDEAEELSREPDYVCGFAEGALEFWRVAKGSL